MKVLIFGATGMLGSTILSYLKKFHFNTIPLTRKDLDLSRVTHDSLKNILIKNNINKGDIIINCAGLIKQRQNIKESQFISVNSLFPNLLSDLESELGYKLIHITTDCVFSGQKGAYTENDKKDIQDVYGLSKLLGENNKSTIIRTSIIGEENNNKLSLLEWVRSNKNGQINGFTNHIWNGVTCLQLSKIIHKMIKQNISWNGVRHIYSNTINKYELVQIINQTYNLNIEITPTKTKHYVDRSLETLFDNNFIIPNLKVQIQELKNFHESLIS